MTPAAKVTLTAPSGTRAASATGSVGAAAASSAESAEGGRGADEQALADARRGRRWTARPPTEPTAIATASAV